MHEESQTQNLKGQYEMVLAMVQTYKYKTIQMQNDANSRTMKQTDRKWHTHKNDIHNYTHLNTQLHTLLHVYIQSYTYIFIHSYI